MTPFDNILINAYTMTCPYAHAVSLDSLKPGSRFRFTRAATLQRTEGTRFGYSTGWPEQTYTLERNCTRRRGNVSGWIYIKDAQGDRYRIHSASTPEVIEL